VGDGDDRDGDGITDGDETRIGTNPDEPRHRRDGIRDGTEVGQRPMPPRHGHATG
jgi:hypothetical protein